MEVLFTQEKFLVCHKIFISWKPNFVTALVWYSQRYVRIKSCCFEVHRHVRPPRLRGFPLFFISQLRVFSCDFAFFTLPDLARIIELSSAQLVRAEIANFAPVS